MDTPNLPTPLAGESPTGPALTLADTGPVNSRHAEDARQRARVTVITRTKDRPLMLRRCMESVLGQSFPDWLHVIVNDGGNPHVVDLLVAEYAARYAGPGRGDPQRR